MQLKSIGSILVPALLALPLVCACSSLSNDKAADGNSSSTGKPAEAKSAKSDDKTDEAKKAAAKERKATKKAHDLANARTELEIAELETQNSTRKATEDLDEAKRELEEARKGLEHFKTYDMPTQLADSRIDYDRAVQRKVEAEQELHEMEETYKKDQFAKDTKELVLTRHRKQLEFATRELELQEKRYADMEHEKLPRDQREKEKKLRDAEQSVREAEVAVRKTELQNKVKLDKAHFEIDELQRPDDEDDGAKGGKS